MASLNFSSKYLKFQVGKDVAAPLDVRSGRAFKLTDKGMTFMVDGEPVTFGDMSNRAVIADAIEKCPPVGFILNKMASAFANGKMQAVNANTGNPVTTSKAHYQRIVDRPNYIQNDTSFRKQVYNYTRAFGRCVVLKVKAKGFENLNEVSSLWALPEEFIDIKEKVKINPTKQRGIRDCLEYVKFDGIKLNLDDVYVFTDDTPYTDSVVLPSSRMTPLKANFENIATNLQSRGRLLNMPMGIFSSGAKDDVSSIALTPAEKEEAEAALENNHGLGRRQKKFIVLSAAVQWQSMSFPISQMDFDVMERLDTISIAEALEYPPFLLGITEKAIYNNVKEAKQALYTDSILPTAKNYDQQFTEMMNSMEDGVKYVTDYSDVPALQADLKDTAAARKVMGEAVINEYKNDVITRNRMLELLGEPLLAPALGDLYYSQTNPKPQNNDAQPPTP